MDTDSSLLFVLLVALIMGGGYFAASETAFASVNAMRIRHRAENGEKAKKIADSVSSCDFLPFSDIPWYKFSPGRATKENAIEYLVKNLEIPLTEIVAFGDDFNDIGMLKLCGQGIAMGNAIPQVKEIADDITLSNNEDGVAKYLERLLK